MVPRHHRWHPKVGIAGLPVQIRAEPPSGRQQGDHMAADDAAIRDVYAHNLV
jgi:hypothetical protein